MGQFEISDHDKSTLAVMNRKITKLLVINKLKAIKL